MTKRKFLCILYTVLSSLDCEGVYSPLSKEDSILSRTNKGHKLHSSNENTYPFVKAVRYGTISNLNPLKESVSEINLPKRSSIVVSALGLNLIISPGKSSDLFSFYLNICFFKSHHTSIVFVLEIPVEPRNTIGILDFIK